MKKRRTSRAKKKEAPPAEQTSEPQVESWAFGLDDELLPVDWSAPPFPAPQPVPERPVAAMNLIQARSLSPAPFAGPAGAPAAMRTVVAMPSRRPIPPANGNPAIAYPARTPVAAFGYFASDTLVFQGDSEAG